MISDCYEFDDANCCQDCHGWPQPVMNEEHGIERFSVYDRRGHLVALSCCRMEERVRATVERTSPFGKEDT